MEATIVWHGSELEAYDLVIALARNCTCEANVVGVGRRSTCAPHRMLMEEQRVLDGLLFTRRVAARLQREEHEPIASLTW